MISRKPAQLTCYKGEISGIKNMNTWPFCASTALHTPLRQGALCAFKVAPPPPAREPEEAAAAAAAVWQRHGADLLPRVSAEHRDHPRTIME